MRGRGILSLLELVKRYLGLDLLVFWTLFLDFWRGGRWMKEYGLVWNGSGSGSDLFMVGRGSGRYCFRNSSRMPLWMKAFQFPLYAVPLGSDGLAGGLS
jgi:hypothetical protein